MTAGRIGMLSALPRTLTFPATRRVFARLLAEESRRRTYFIAACWWLLTLAVLPVYTVLRSSADGLGMPAHGSGAERLLFGTVTSVKLQEWFWGSGSETIEWAAVIIHSSWFFVPGLVGLLVTAFRPHRVGSFVRWWVAVELLALVFFALLPMRPPWMESEEVTRIIALRFGGEIDDSNPVAAMPSLHVAFPFVIALWLTRERWMLPAFAMYAYTALIAFEVVLTGEHYVVDVMGAIAFGLIIAALARINFSALGSRALSWVKLHLNPVPRLSALKSERGQALIELAFVLPVMLVFLLVLVDFGLAMDRREVIQHAAREGARKGAVGYTEAAVISETVNQSQGVLDSSDISVCYVDGPDSGTTAGNVGDNVRVEIDFDYQFTAGSGELLATLGLAPPSINMNPHAEARLESTIPGATAC